MKKLVLVICICLFVVVPVFAAEEENIFAGMDYAGDSSLAIGYLQLNMDALGEAIVGAGYPALPDGLIVWGAGSMMGFRDGLRWGGWGFSAETKKKGANDALSYLVFNLGGAALDYGFVLTDSLDIGLGAFLGGGGYELTLRKHAVENLGDSNKIFVKNAFFVVGPRVNADVRMTDWLVLQANATYLYGIGDQRWSDEGLKTDVIPAFRINGLMATLNLVFAF